MPSLLKRFARWVLRDEDLEFADRLASLAYFRGFDDARQEAQFWMTEGYQQQVVDDVLLRRREGRWRRDHWPRADLYLAAGFYEVKH